MPAGSAQKYGDDAGLAKGVDGRRPQPAGPRRIAGGGPAHRLLAEHRLQRGVLPVPSGTSPARPGPDAVLPRAGGEVLGRLPRRAAQGRSAGADRRHELAGPRLRHPGAHARPVQARLRGPARLLGSSAGRREPEMADRHGPVPQSAHGQGGPGRSGHAEVPGRRQPRDREGLGAGARPAHDRQRVEHLPAQRVLARGHRPDGRLRAAPGVGRLAGIRLLQPGLAQGAGQRLVRPPRAIRRRSSSSPR